MTAELTALEQGKGWLLLAAGDDLQRGALTGYPDEPSSHYVWDSTVPHHLELAPGDLVVLWDMKRLLGLSLIETIEISQIAKTVYRCPSCDKADFKARKVKTPQYRCHQCRAEFDEPAGEVVDVTAYRSVHDMSWVDLPAVLSGAELRSLCTQPKSQQSMRPLDTGLFLAALTSRVGIDPLSPVIDGSNLTGGSDGHQQVVVRARRGQASFRASLIEKYDNYCAVLGEQPLETLEACHLYSYADLGKHLDHGGLLLRRDIHRLFDLGRIAVDPRTLQLDLDIEVRSFSDYQSLHGARLSIPVHKKQKDWLALHWERHRGDKLGTSRVP
jgi:hypothetical protein